MVLLQDLPLFALWTALAFLTTVPLRPSGGLRELYQRSAGKFEALFFGVLFLGLFASRAAVLAFPHDLNLDEAQFVSQALGYGRTWIPFSQDGHTCGPLNYYILMWPLAAGLPITYLTIRLTGFVFILLTIFCILRIVSNIAGRRWAYLITFPLISFYLFAYQPGFVHYSSEHFPDLLLAASGWIIVRLWRNEPAPLFLLGVMLGATPFTKLQASPLAVYFYLVAVAMVLFKGKDLLTRLLRLIAGGAIAPLAITIPLLAAGRLPDAIHRYIIVPSHYGSGIMTVAPVSIPTLIYYFARSGPQFTIYFIDLMVGVALGLLLLFRTHRQAMPKAWLVGLGICAAYLALTIFAVLKPNLAYCHYLLLLPFPTLLVVAWIARGCRLYCPPSLVRRGQLVAVGLFLAASLLTLPLYIFSQEVFPYMANDHQPLVDPVSVFIESVTKPGDTMANWGYTPKYYVETQVPPAVRDFATLYEPFPDPQYDYYRESFLDDLRRFKPRVIVDSIGEFYLDTWPRPIELARAAHYPPLAQFLEENYEPAKEFSSGPSSPPVLVYVRKS